MAPYKPQQQIHYTGAPSLVEMAQRSCIRNISRVQDVGDIPWKLVGPILKKVDNPEQLQQIEEASPHIANHDAELWRAFIAREIPQWQEKIIEPKNPRSWGKVYRKLKREEQRRLEAQEEELRARMAGINKQREANQATIVEKVMAEPRRQKAFIDGVPNSNARSWGNSVTAKKPTLKSAKNGREFISALRRPASNATRGQKPGVIPPTIPSAKSQIPRAPESMLREHAKPASVAMPRQHITAEAHRARIGSPAPRIIVSRRPPNAQDIAVRDAERAEQSKREERLRALTSGSSKSTGQSPPVTPAKATTITSAPSIPKESHSPIDDGSPVRSEEPRAALKAIGDAMRRPSPSPTPPAIRKRPATPVSVFMPTPKKRKV